MLYGTRIAFVNNHLAAHQERAVRRISDVREIFDGLELGYHSSGTQFSSRFNTFYFGDLNFRLEGSREEILDLIRCSRSTPTPRARR